MSAEAAYVACYGSGDDALASAPPNLALMTERAASAEAVLMASLEVGDAVLTVAVDGGLEVTRIVVNQHQHDDDEAELLVLHLSSGAELVLTPTHAIFADGALVAASEATVGAVLECRAEVGAAAKVVVERVERTRGAVINPVTAAGTLLASDRGPPVLAASHPMWIAPILVGSVVARALANAALAAVGDSERVRSRAPALERPVAFLRVPLGRMVASPFDWLETDVTFLELLDQLRRR